MAFKSTRGYALAGYWADLVMEGKPLSQGETWGQGWCRGTVRRVQPDCISLSTFPVQGIYYPVCEYLSMYLYVLVGLYLPFWGEDEGVPVRSCLQRGVCSSMGQPHRWGFF